MEQQGISISMDGKGRALDNVFIERFWRSLKQEKIYRFEFETVREARAGIQDYIIFYNEQRPHQSLKYQTPEMVHFKEAIANYQEAI